MLYIIFILCYILALVSTPSIAQSVDQQRDIDSLSALVNSEVHDTIRLMNLNRLARLFYTTEPDKGQDYAKKSMELCDKLRAGPAASGGQTGNFFMETQWAYAHQSMAVCHYIKGEHPQALEYFFKTITLFEQLLIEFPGNMELTKDLARTYANAGNIFGREKNNEKALEFFFKALSLFDRIGSPGSDMANTYINIGNIYKDMSKGGDEGELISKAMDYYFKALKIAEKLNDKRRIASCYTNIGTLYALIRNSPLAIEYLQKGLAFHREAGNKWGVAYTLLAIGQEYVMLGKPEEARNVLAQAAGLAREVGAKKEIANIFEIMAYADTAMAMKDASSSSGWWKDAFQHYRTFKHLNDSIINEENLKALAKAEAKFDYDKELAVQTAERDKERLMAQEESRRKNIIMVATSIILLLTAIFALYIFTRFRIISRQKNIIQQQNVVLEDANQEISFQKQVIQEKNKDITDSIQYASRIQRTILPKDEIFKEMFPDSFIFYKPRDIVSGDFYWVASPPSNPPVGEMTISPPTTGEAGRGAVLLIIADCTGHGVPGALMSMIANDQLTHIIGEKRNFTAAEILEELDLRVRRILHTDESGDVKDGLDIAVCFLDHNQNVINYSGANNPLWLIRNNNLTEYRADRTGIGGIRNAQIRFKDHFIGLEKNDQFYLFTDGFFDQFGGMSSGGKKFSRKNFRNLILSLDSHPMEEQKNILEKTFAEWKGNGEQTDDVTVIGIKI